MRATSNGRTWLIVAAVLGGLLVLCCAGGVAVALIGGGQAQSGQAQQPARIGAQQVVDAIGAQWPVPNPRDNSSICTGKRDNGAIGCLSRVTTDAVTVTEYPDATAARKSADALDQIGVDARQVGRFVLSWIGEQVVTSSEARDGMVAIVQGLS